MRPSIEGVIRQTLSDRDEFKLIKRVEQLRKQHPNLKVSSYKKPVVVGGIADNVYEIEVEF